MRYDFNCFDPVLSTSNHHLTNPFLVEILTVRKNMWTHVATRLHKPIKVFPFGPNASELMLYGIVAYKLKDGRKTEAE
jgi:hypothetical protein